MNRVDGQCPYCDTKFSVEFDMDDDELLFCPSCGEELPDPELEEDPWQGDPEDEWE